MRSARSSVDDAAGRSPCATWLRACVTSEWVAGDRWFSRAGCGARTGGWDGGCGDVDSGDGGGADSGGGDGWDGDRRGATREQAPSISAAVRIAPSLLNEWLSLS